MAAAEAKDVKPDQTVSEEKEEAQPRGGGSLLTDIEGTPIRVTDPWPAQIPEGVPVVRSTKKTKEI